MSTKHRKLNIRNLKEKSWREGKRI